MKLSRVLPALPDITVSQLGASDLEPFLIIKRQLLQARYPTGELSPAFAYDSVGRRALDAVVIVAWASVEGEVCVYLRSSVRPPLAERAFHSAAGDRDANTGLWELPAGLIEPSDFDRSAGREHGITVAAARELREELGFDVAPSRFRTLGHGVFPSPAMTAEKQFFVSVDVTGEPWNQPLLDGSPLEEHAVIVLIPLSSALTFCVDGRITDAKTEIALRRLSAAQPA